MSGAGPVLVPGEPPRVGRFRIAAKIGTGSICNVYLAMDTREGVWRALKVLAFDRMGDERARSRFKRECEAARSIQHPHLLAAHDAADDSYTPWLALEVCEGGSLRDWVDRRGPMPPYLAIEVMVQVCSGLSAAHRGSLAQRRLEPRDILIDRYGKCKLTDFRPIPGAATGLGSDSVDLRNDVVGAGNVLHFLLTGRPYLEGEPLAGVPDPLQAVIVRAMQRGRGQGYADASAMGRELEAAMLEVSMPSGAVANLVDDDAALPDTVEEMFAPDEVFVDLERAARWAADPSAGPERVERDSNDLMKLFTAPGAPRTEAAASRAPVGYTMPSQTPAPAPPGRPVAASARKTPDLGPILAGPSLHRTTPGPTAGRATPNGRRTPDLPLGARSVTQTPAPGARPHASTPAPASRSDLSRAQYQPDYVVDEPKPQRDDGWREATPPPVERQTAPPSRTVEPWMLAIAGVLVFLVVLAAFGKGAYDVKQARLVADDAGENLTAIVEAEGAVVNDLVARGADRAHLEARFFAYREAHGPARYHAADAFAAALLEEAAKAGIDAAAPIKDRITERVSAIGEARTRYLRERRIWAETAGGFPGVLPVIVGVSSAPE